MMCVQLVAAQEGVRPSFYNSVLQNSTVPFYKKTRAINLPFVDDFTGASNGANGLNASSAVYPNVNLWQGPSASVYVNNNFGINPPTAGVATFDALDANGTMYNIANTATSFYADSLHSVSIDLSANLPSDSIYLSFFVQPQGNGFKPETNDSLLLYFKNITGDWIKVWHQLGSAVTAFKLVMIPVKQNTFFHAGFEFLFVNVASPNSNDDVWNLDYVRLAASRTFADSNVNDVAFVNTSASILNDYTSMPYWQFFDYQNKELDSTYKAYIKNNFTTAKVAGVNLKSTEMATLSTLAADNASIAPAALNIDSAVYNTYNFAFSPATPFSDVVLQHKYSYGTVPGDVLISNDTLTKTYAFRNYFAYDDGTNEKGYYLFGLLNFPVKSALEFHVNKQDTLFGLALKFAQQTPSAAGKQFNIVLYKQLGTTSATEQILLDDAGYNVAYEPGIEGFSVYQLSAPYALDSGTYFIGTTQLPNTNSDTIYFGLDMNTNANTKHLYYNVDGQWQTSNVAGSVMLRPIVGRMSSPTSVKEMMIREQVQVYPNPAKNILHVAGLQKASAYKIIDAQGQQMQAGIAKDKQIIDVSTLSGGIYFLLLQKGNTIKFIKE
jgi:rhodanese-related sulfurtransferase